MQKVPWISVSNQQALLQNGTVQFEMRTAVENLYDCIAASAVVIQTSLPQKLGPSLAVGTLSGLRSIQAAYAFKASQGTTLSSQQSRVQRLYACAGAYATFTTRAGPELCSLKCKQKFVPKQFPLRSAVFWSVPKSSFVARKKEFSHCNSSYEEFVAHKCYQ